MIEEALREEFGEYGPRRLRSQRQVIRDVMLAAAEKGAWLTLGELAALTKYGEASISSQLRNLRRPDSGAFRVVKRIRKKVKPAKVVSDRRGQWVWEYRIERGGV